MLKKFMVRSAKLMAALALLAGSLPTNVACIGAYYQPEVPEKMKIYNQQ